MKNLFAENRTTHNLSYSYGRLQMLETDDFLQKLAQDILKVTAVNKLTEKLQTCQLDGQTCHKNKIKGTGQKSYRIKPYEMVSDKTVDKSKRNTSVLSLERIDVSMSTIPAPGRPPRWWSLLPDYQFTDGQARSETTGNPPEWWLLQMPDDSLYKDEKCAESEKDNDLQSVSKTEETVASKQT